MKIVFFVGLINLFFVPMIPVYLYYKKTDRPLKPNLELLFHYGITTALIIPIAKVIVFLPSRVLHGAIPIESSYYTIAALATAWLLPHIASLLQNTTIEVKFKRHEDTEIRKAE